MCRARNGANIGALHSVPQGSNTAQLRFARQPKQIRDSGPVVAVGLFQPREVENVVGSVHSCKISPASYEFRFARTNIASPNEKKR